MPNVAIAGIDHIPNDTLHRFNGNVRDDEAAASQTVYKAEDVLLVAIADPRTKALQLLSGEDKKRDNAGLNCHIKGREEELRAV